MTRTPPSIERLRLKGPIAISAGGKAASAVRDLTPLLVFGVGTTLDTLVLSTMVGVSLASVAISTALPVCLPVVAQSEQAGARRIRRFRGVFVLLGIAAVVAQQPLLALLGLGHPSAVVRTSFSIAVAAGVVQAVNSTLAVRLYARENYVGLALPLGSGLLALPALLVSERVDVFAAVLLVGGLLDHVLLRRALERSVPTPTVEPAENRTGRTSMIVLNQVVIFGVILADRALMSRAGQGVVGATAMASRASFAVVGIIAGALEPQLMRLVAQRSVHMGRTARRIAGISGVVGAVSAMALLMWLTVDVSATWPIFAASAAVYAMSTPAAVLQRMARSAVQGLQLFTFDLALTVLGGVMTVGLGAFGLALGSVDLMVAAIPLSTCVVALAAGIAVRRLDDWRVVHG